MPGMDFSGNFTWVSTGFVVSSPVISYRELLDAVIREKRSINTSLLKYPFFDFNVTLLPGALDKR